MSKPVSKKAIDFSGDPRVSKGFHPKYSSTFSSPIKAEEGTVDEKREEQLKVLKAALMERSGEGRQLQ